VIIALGHFSMAIPTMNTFYLGLALIVIGTGLLKPNVSTLVGSLYAPNDVRRDAGFSIYYMGINLGALVAPLVCGYLGENINWHYGFGAAGVGMTAGVIQYALGDKYLGKSGLAPRPTADDFRLLKRGGIAIAAVVTLGIVLGSTVFSAERLSDVFGVLLSAIVVVFFFWLLSAKGYTALERRRFWAILVLFIASAAFWSAFEQAGSTLNLFAERNTNLHTWDFPLWGLFRASYLQSFNSIFIIALAPVFAWIWIALKRREPSVTAKFSLGLIFVGLGFAILIPVAGGQLASPWWLTGTYLLHTIGELCLSPVGMSAMTKLAPERIGGLMMGVWFLSISVGDYIGGRLASVYETFPLPTLFGIVAGFCIVVGVLLVLLLGPMKRLTGGVH
jgi:POT family proton-dependent oligopeptide transporter